jgi:two-component system, OmpR family, response regulator
LILQPRARIVASRMGRQHRILLVDDNLELLELLGRLVKAEGWTPVPLGRGRAAVDSIAREPPSVAVIDVLLPDMMGYEVGAAARKAGVPFVFITGVFKGSRADSEARVQHGAAGYFEKPFEAKRLMDAIRALLPGGPEARPPAFPPEDEPDFHVEVSVEPEEAVPAIELSGKIELGAGGRVVATIRGETLTAASVQPTAPARASPPHVVAADEGELHDNLPDLVTAFWLAQQSGAVALERGPVRKVLFFQGGRPCFAISNLVADRLGSFLVRVGKLTEAQLALCLAAAEGSGKRLGQVLVEMGLLQETERPYYLGQQVKAIAYSLFAWEGGHYRMHFTDRMPPDATKVDLHPAHLISRGVKGLYLPARLARLLPNDARLIPTQQPAYGLHEVALERWEAELLPRVDGTRTVSELIALAGRPAPTVHAFLWSLVALEILEKR